MKYRVIKINISELDIYRLPEYLIHDLSETEKDLLKGEWFSSLQQIINALYDKLNYKLVSSFSCGDSINFVFEIPENKIKNGIE